jgi:hypothetical protein
MVSTHLLLIPLLPLPPLLTPLPLRFHRARKAMVGTHLLLSLLLTHLVNIHLI